MRDTYLMKIAIDNPRLPDVVALLNDHLDDMRAISPAGSVHALDIDALCTPELTFWTAREDGFLMGCGALKHLDGTHAEIKSMRTAPSFLRRGVAFALLTTILNIARARRYRQVSLETGSSAPFAPAIALYERFGFRCTGPFAQYRDDPFSVFMTLHLDATNAIP